MPYNSAITKKFGLKNLSYLAWAIALASMLGSLFFSNVLGYPPCVLCWYQRIFMYPLVLIIPIGVVKKDKYLPLYVLPLAILGWMVAFWHNLLYYNLISESSIPCLAGISCTTKFIEWFGFITIPLLSLAAFSTIIACMALKYKYESRN